MARSIAIVEDNQPEARLLKEYISRYSEENGILLQVSHFESGVAFLEKYQPVHDIILLDIGLPGLNGLETAERIRELDQTTTIIFITNMAQFAVRGYEVDAFDFVVKPVSYSNFSLKLKRALNRISSRMDQEVVVSFGGNVYRIASSQIKYIEVSGHKLTYHSTGGSIEAYGNLKDVEAKLNSKMFVRCNHCYLVNLSHVCGVEGTDVILDGARLQMSRPKRKAFLQSLNDFLGGGI